MLNTRFTLLFVCVSSILVAFTKANVIMVTRLQWGAVEPKAELPKLDLPVSRVIIMDTPGHECSDYHTCILQLRSIQRFHMNYKNLADIYCNFLVDSDGNVYEGRGWDQQGDFSKENKADSLGITFIGSYEKTEPSNKSLEAAKSLLEIGLRMGKISNNYKLLGHRQVFPTHNPGDLLFNVIKKWPQWSTAV